VKLTKTFFKRALEACAILDVYLNMVEKASTLDRRQHEEHYNKDPKRAGTARHRRQRTAKVHESVH
jgi:hypothetical protein